MEEILQQFQDLKIQLEEIKSATNNFDDQNNYIGRGGFGKVYKGEVTHHKGRSMAAIKRLDRRHGQGTPEFLKEIMMLSRYRHENLISLMGFCYQGDEMILVYKHASRGSLECYLNSPHLSWTQRLKICLDVAKGVSYLHDPGETHQRLIHCDIKSANILLDEQWNAKVSDFGLSIMGPANEQQSVIVTLAAGTQGYIDPLYWMTHTLTKESDVYSLGVVLFEVLCGRLCCTYSNGRVQQNLVPVWTESYKQKKLIDIIFKSPAIQPMDQSTLEIFSDIAYRCLKESREDRPKMAEVVTELKTALENQELLESGEFIEWKEQPFYCEELVKTAQPPLKYRSEVELMRLLYKGVLLNGGKTYFSLNKEGEHCEIISIAECLGSDIQSDKFSTEYNSRFFVGPYQWYKDEILKTQVKSQFLSPGIRYTVNLVFKFRFPINRRRCERISLKYKLQGEIEYSISHLAYEREDGWWMCELYQLTCDQRIIHLRILFVGFNNSIQVEGIEFRPLEKVEHKDENQPISDLDSDTYWEEKIPTDYQDIMKRSENILQWTTKEEAYSILRKGFLISESHYFRKGSIWFSLDKNGKKCHMLSAALVWHFGEIMFLPESRFGEAIRLIPACLIIKIKVQSQLVSSGTAYAIYLIYKFPNDQFGCKAPMRVDDRQWNSGDKTWYIYLTSPQTPVIRLKDDQNTHNPLNKPKFICLPQQRNDGWKEVQLWEWGTTTTTTIYVDLMLSLRDEKNLGWIIIEGIEFRPI